MLWVLSTLSGILCNSTAPTPYGDASHDKISGRELSKCTKTEEDFRAVLVAWNAGACFAVHDHFVLCSVTGIMVQES